MKIQNHNPMNRVHCLLAAAVAICLLPATGKAQLTVIAQDTFGTPTADLNGTLTDTIPGFSPETWTTDHSGFIVSGGVLNSPGGFYGGTIPFNPSANPTLAFSLSADLTPAGGSWLSLGFYTGDPGTLNTQIWVLLRANSSDVSAYGDYAINIGSGAGLVALSGTVPGFNLTGDNTVSMLYDPVSTNVTITIDGTTVVNAPESVVNLAGITEAGFTEASPGTYDNFVLSQAPEPGSVALLGCGVVFMAVRFLRGSRKKRVS